MMKYFTLLAFAALLPWLSTAETIHNADSLLATIHKLPNDTSKVNALNNFAYSSYRENPARCIDLSRKALTLSKNLNYLPGQIKSNNLLGIGHLLLSEFYESETRFMKAKEIAESINDTANIAKSIINLGALAVRSSNYDKAIKYNLEALKINEAQNNFLGIAKCYANIGINHKEAKNYDLALEYLRKGVNISDSINDLQNLSICLNAIGTTQSQLKKHESSNKYYFKAVDLYLQLSDFYGLAITYGNIASNYNDLNKYDSALVYVNHSNKYAKQINYKPQLSTNYKIMADIYLNNKKYLTAINFSKSALKIAEELELNSGLKSITLQLSNIYKELGDFNSAYKFLDLNRVYSDSILTSEKQELIIELDAKYNSERKQREIEILQKDKLLKQEQLHSQDQQLKYQRLQTTIILIALLSVIIIATIFYKNYRIKKLSNNQLTKQRNTIAKQNKKITDSIIYAKHIQEAILPHHSKIKQLLPNSFLFYLPRDIVSGDFFWIRQFEEKILIAVVDCTGHGVPGAFMSILGNQLLNEINDLNKTPAEMLNELRDKLKKAMKQSDYFTSQRDGMDAALCSINTKTKCLDYAGANINLLHHNNNEINIIKANNQPVAIYLKESDFKNHTIKYSETDTFYLSTDGYVDQYGGKNNEKYKSKKLRNLLIKNAAATFPVQKQKIHAEFLKWKGENEQIDDVTVLGFKCP